jgi:hypothetical protein
MLNKIFRKFRGVAGAGVAPLEPKLDSMAVSRMVGEALQDRRPFLVSRLGFTEAQCLTQKGGVENPSDDTLMRIHRFSGVFPEDRGEFRRFGETYLHALSQTDLLGLIGTATERELVEAYVPGAARCSLGSLEPYFCEEPWTRHLAGMSVCVVHPFSESISRQYESVREKIFPGTGILPLFSLRVVKAPQTIAGNTDGYSSWSAALEELKVSVVSEDFDAAILGCGAYGLPLGAFLKAQGKTVIHLGGATQLLFGVSGARWRENPAFDRIINDAWKPPLESERPPGWEKIEKGCYW